MRSAMKVIALFFATCSNALHMAVAPPRAIMMQHSLVQRTAVVRMAGFGGGAAKPAKGGKGKSKKESKAPAAKLSMKRQWDRLNELVGGGAPRNPVFARLPDAEWLPVGDVACAAGTSVAAAVQLHKRFILEHATRVSPKLALQSKLLECGYIDAIQGFDEPARLEKVEAAPVADAGFEGAPDPSARYAALSNMDAVKKMDEANSNLKMGGY